MIIVSQDKSEIFNFERAKRISVVEIFNFREEKVEGYSIQIDSNSFGEYETEERAKEVLKEIAMATVQGKEAEDANSIFGFNIIPKNALYEMPKE